MYCCHILYQAITLFCHKTNNGASNGAPCFLRTSHPFPSSLSIQSCSRKLRSLVRNPESHIFSADLPGVRKEEIEVEVEDSRYLIIRTDAIDESSEPARRFIRKFRLPGRVDIDGISAKYEDGVLTVTVPRSFTRRGFYIDPGDLPQQLDTLARAA